MATRWDPFVTRFSIPAPTASVRRPNLTGAYRGPQFYRVHLNESGLWFSAPRSGGPGYVTDGREFPPQLTSLQFNVVNPHASNKRPES